MAACLSRGDNLQQDLGRHRKLTVVPLPLRLLLHRDAVSRLRLHYTDAAKALMVEVAHPSFPEVRPKVCLHGS